jgi:glutamate dehydrogenase
MSRLAEMAAASDRCETTAARYTARGVNRNLAYKIAALDRLPRALDIVELAVAHDVEVETVASFYDSIGDQLEFEGLVDRIVALPRADRWDALARNALREDAIDQQRRIVDGVMAAGSYEAWAATRATVLQRVLALLADVHAHGVYDVATLSVALRELRALT